MRRRMTKEEQEEEYAKAKPFSREGRMRASKVALGMIKGQPESVRAKHQAAQATSHAVGQSKAEARKKDKAKQKAVEDARPNPPPGKPKLPVKK